MALQPFVAELSMGGFNFAPRNWAMCRGSILPIAQNTALFSLLGTTYGGNGQTTFALPDLSGRLPVGMGQGPGLSSWSLGQVTGTETHTLTTNEMPAHSHGLGAINANATTANPAGALPAKGRAVANGTTAALPMYQTGATTVAMNPTGIAGGSQPHDNRMPYLATNFIIALTGIFPS